MRELDARAFELFLGQAQYDARQEQWDEDDPGGESLGSEDSERSRSEEDDFAYHMRRARGVPRCLHAVEVGGLCFDFDAPRRREGSAPGQTN